MINSNQLARTGGPKTRHRPGPPPTGASEIKHSLLKLLSLYQPTDNIAIKFTNCDEFITEPTAKQKEIGVTPRQSWELHVNVGRFFTQRSYQTARVLSVLRHSNKRQQKCMFLAQPVVLEEQDRKFAEIQDIWRVASFSIDIDNQDGDWRGFIGDALEPTLVVRTGGGWQLHWFVLDFVRAEPTRFGLLYQTFIRKFKQRASFDPSNVQIAQGSRLPDTWNVRRGRFARIAFFSGRKYWLDELCDVDSVVSDLAWLHRERPEDKKAVETVPAQPTSTETKRTKSVRVSVKAFRIDKPGQRHKMLVRLISALLNRSNNTATEEDASQLHDEWYDENKDAIQSSLRSSQSDAKSIYRSLRKKFDPSKQKHKPSPEGSIFTNHNPDVHHPAIEQVPERLRWLVDLVYTRQLHGEFKREYFIPVLKLARHLHCKNAVAAQMLTDIAAGGWVTLSGYVPHKKCRVIGIPNRYRPERYRETSADGLVEIAQQEGGRHENEAAETVAEIADARGDVGENPCGATAAVGVTGDQALQGDRDGAASGVRSGDVHVKRCDGRGYDALDVIVSHHRHQERVATCCGLDG
ncbi:MAG TPA: hypothetical protein VGP72_16615 [Planctomycetota bacterium]|jgi:hypothetical protein